MCFHVQMSICLNMSECTSETLAQRRQEHRANQEKTELYPNLCRCSIWLNEDVQCRTGTRQFNHLNTKAYLQLRCLQRTCLHLCVSAGKDKRTKAAILSADGMSPFSGLTLKEVSPLSFPLDTLRLSNNTDDTRKSQNTVPLKPFGC